jgi:hypothetical protein
MLERRARCAWRMTACLLLLMAACLAACLTVSAQPLPPLNAQTLSGKKLVLPHDVDKTSVLVIGFSKRSREQTETWAKRLREDPLITHSASVYDVVALDGVPGFIRSAILRQLTSGIPKARHDHFLVVSDAVDAWKQRLAVNDEDLAYVAIVTSNGDVLWTARGAVTNIVYEQLARTLRARP